MASLLGMQQFLSPLWSASKSRRISFKEHKDINQEAFTNALKKEIVRHLDGMEQQIQQAKVDTYNKVQTLERFVNGCDESIHFVKGHGVLTDFFRHLINRYWNPLDAIQLQQDCQQLNPSICLRLKMTVKAT